MLLATQDFDPIDDLGTLEAAPRALLAYWEKRRGERVMPAPAEIDPLDLASNVLSFLTVIDIESDPLDFRYRFVGTRVVEAAGVDRTGRRASEIYNAETLEKIMAAIRAVLAAPGRLPCAAARMARPRISRLRNGAVAALP